MELNPLQAYKLTQKGKELVYRVDWNVVSCIYLHDFIDDYYKVNYHYFLTISKEEYPDGKFSYNTETVRISEKDLADSIEFTIKTEDGYELLKIDTYDYSPFKREDVVGLLKSENEFLRQIVNNFSKK